MRCDQANGENAARSARAPLKNGAAVRGSRLKIATDVAGVLGSSEAPAKTGHSFSLARMEINGAQRGTRSNWERDGANGENVSPWLIFRSGLTPRWARLDPTLSGICRTISSSRNRPQWTCRAPAGSRTPRQADTQRQWGRDLNVTSFRPGAEAHPLTFLSKTTWTICPPSSYSQK